MGYQESWLYIEPQHKFKKLIQAYEKAEQSGYYEVAGAEPHSVIVLKQPCPPESLNLTPLISPRESAPC